MSFNKITLSNFKEFKDVIYYIKALYLVGNGITAESLEKLSLKLVYFANLALLDLRGNKLRYSDELKQVFKKFT